MTQVSMTHAGRHDAWRHVTPDEMEAAGLAAWESVHLSRSLAAYVKAAWRHSGAAADLRWSWYLDAICEHLQAVSSGQIRRLVINQPPRTLKSWVTSVYWPTWEWAKAPWEQWLYISYAQSLSFRDSQRCRMLIQTPWYQERWGHVYQLGGAEAGDATKTRLDTVELTRRPGEPARRGHRIASSVGGWGTGEGGSRIVVDDFHSADEAASDAVRKSSIDWWSGTMTTRANSPETRWVVVGQRLHERDLTGHLLAEGGWEHLCLPMEADGQRRSTILMPAGYDPRAYGDLLHPERFDADAVRKLKVALGSYGASGQLQQSPSPDEGGWLKRQWWRFWVPYGSPLADVPVMGPGHVRYPVITAPRVWPQVILSLDASFKDEAAAARSGRAPDPVCCGAVARVGGDLALLDLINKPLDVVGSCQELLAMSNRWPQAVTKLIEDKANGPAMMQLLRRRISGLTPVTPTGSKVSRVLGTAATTDRDRDARAMSMAALLEAGNLMLPHPAIAPWSWDVIEQCARFPNGEHDDIVDMLSQAVAYLQPWSWREQDAAHREGVAERGLPPADTTEEIHRRALHGTVARERRKADAAARMATGRGAGPGGAGVYRRAR